jgi:AraC-like DNA-binding protein
MSATVHVGTLHRILAVAEAQGVDPGDLGRRAGLGAMPDGDARFPVAKLYALWRAAQEHTGIPGFSATVARASRMDEMGVFGFAVMTTPHGLDALRLAGRLFPMVNDSGSFRVDVGARSVTARWDCPPVRDGGHHLSTESVLAHFAGCTREILGPDVRLCRVTLGHELTATSAAALSAFFDCTVEHGTGQDALHFVRDSLERAPGHASPGMHAFLREQAERALTGLRRAVALSGDLVARVREEILRRLSDGDVSMEAVASALAMAPRTLRRRLADREVAFQRLVEEVRREQARALLADPGRSITEVALDLGFAETSAFTRAYRRWYGVPPSQGRGRGVDQDEAEAAGRHMMA